MDPLQYLPTESRHPESDRLDELTSLEIVRLINRADATIAAAVATQAEAIARAIDELAVRFAKGGRLIYVGAGTSGRLGVLDAAECPPTFQTPPELVHGLIAGGTGAMFRAVEGAEDSPELGATDLESLHLQPWDTVFGIATSGRTPYVLGAMKFAKQRGALTIGLSCVAKAELSSLVDLPIEVVVGPEILTGSTRLKAGTATKLVLNTLTTGAMVRLGKTFGNLMVDLKATNSKLIARTNRIVRTVCGIDETAAARILGECSGEVKTAIVAQLNGLDPNAARERLEFHGGRVRCAIATTQSPPSIDHPELVLGIDGGGTTTIALLARKADGQILGRGLAGPSNIQSVGVPAGLKSLDDAIAQAFQSAGLPLGKVASACLGLAGVDRREGLDVIHGWAERVNLAGRVQIANDATLLLAAGTPHGWGLAVIAGTGSIAFARKPTGEVGRCGGWGHLLGDEGSAYRIALNGLRAACRSFDGIGRNTSMIEAFVKAMDLHEAPDFIPAVYRGAWDRTAIAGLAPVVLKFAEDGDELATEIVSNEASELALTAAQAVRANGLALLPIPVALAGGVLSKSATYREQFLKVLAQEGVIIASVEVVIEPALGAVVLARNSE